MNSWQQGRITDRRIGWCFSKHCICTYFLCKCYCTVLSCTIHLYLHVLTNCQVLVALVSCCVSISESIVSLLYVHTYLNNIYSDSDCICQNGELFLWKCFQTLLHPPCLALTLTLSSSLTEFDPSAELAVPREAAGNKGTFAGKMGLIGLWFDSAPRGSGQTPSHVQQLTNGYSSVRDQVSQKPGHDSRLSYKAALFYGHHLVWLPFWQTIHHRTHPELVCPLSASCSSLAHIHTSAKKTPRTHTPVSDGPVFHWGIIDWKMKMDACTSQALLINETHRVYYGGAAPVPNTSRGRAVSLRCWPPITALTGWVWHRGGGRSLLVWETAIPLFVSGDTLLRMREGNGLEMGRVMLSAPASLSNDNRHNTEPLTDSLWECLARQTDRPAAASERLRLAWLLTVWWFFRLGTQTLIVLKKLLQYFKLH